VFDRNVAWAVTAAGLPVVESSLLHELDLAFFDDRFKGAIPTEQRALELMVREPGQLRLNAFAGAPGRRRKPEPRCPPAGRMGTDLPSVAGHL
jgi:hypothetical protein